MISFIVLPSIDSGNKKKLKITVTSKTVITEGNNRLINPVM